MKRIYEVPEAEIMNVDTVDVITVSSPSFKDNNVLDDGWLEA